MYTIAYGDDMRCSHDELYYVHIAHILPFAAVCPVQDVQVMMVQHAQT